MRLFRFVFLLFYAVGAAASQANVLQEAELLRQSGREAIAFRLLETAAQDANEAAEQIPLRLQLARWQLQKRLFGQAQENIDQSLTTARAANEKRLLAQALNMRGNLLAVQGSYNEALPHYQESLALSNDTPVFAVDILLNLVQTYRAMDNAASASTALAQAEQQINDLPDSPGKASQLLGLGQWSTPNKSIGFYREALRIARQHDDKSLQSLALGYLGERYFERQDDSNALKLFRRAAFLSQTEPSIHFRWQWGIGRVLHRQGDIAGALASYQHAVDTAQPVRFVVDNRLNAVNADNPVRTLYFEFANLLLAQVGQVRDDTQQNVLLKQTVQALEQLKASELQDYFRDACVSRARQRVKTSTPATIQAAVFYPIVLPEKLVLLLNQGEDFTHVEVDVDADTLADIANLFRVNLTKRTTFDYFQQSRQLYDWLIKPIQPHLLQVKTLVIVPDGVLRTIPFAPLHDGEQYLLEKYALAVTPGLELTEITPQPLHSPQVLLNGLSESVDDFAPLPNVPKELEQIRDLFGEGAVLQDNRFLLANLEQSLQETSFSVVHIASHGQFKADPSETFLLAYDGHLTMDRLEQVLGYGLARDKPVELLTLSACQTAVGDDRAALGLAGVAVKAGARSALASLWFVDDSATSALMVKFYEFLRKPGTSKAEALQQAQLDLLSQRLFRHPAYWAAFLMIGNWQ